MPSGKFNLRGDAKGFVTFLAKEVAVATGAPSTLDIPMSIATDAQAVQVSDNSATSVSVDPSQNVGAIVLGKEDIDNLPDDPDDLQSDLQALAGPSAGPNGAQFFITDAAAAHLDGGFTIFGVCASVEVVHAIAAVPVRRETPVTPVEIRHVTVKRAR